MRTPVSSMRMLAESLEMGHVRDPDKQKQFLRTIVTECDRLSQLVERVLFFVRFGQDALVYSLRETDPAVLVESVVRSFAARFSGSAATATDAGPRTEADRADKAGGNATPGSSEGRVSAAGLTLRWRFAPDLPGVDVDEAAVTQLVLNLLDNAVKYSCRGSADIRVDVDRATRRRRPFGREKTWVIIMVRDHGIGIRRQELRRIFRKFYRGRGARRDHVSGVGLGLAMCRHIAVAHGGWIEAQSVPGEGSTFKVFLPPARAGVGSADHRWWSRWLEIPWH